MDFTIFFLLLVINSCCIIDFAIETMKKLYLTLAITVSLIILFPYYTSAQSNKPVYANIQTEYLRVLDKTTPFYKNVYDSQPLFFLPFSYYVKVLGLSGEYYHIELHGNNGQIAIDGYAPCQKLFDDDLAVSFPYLELTITTVSTAVLYSDKNLSMPLQYIFPERNLSYYGEIQTEQGTLFYVGYNSRLGYVKESDVYPFVIENHPNPLPKNPSDSPTDEPSSYATQTGIFGLRTIIVACLIFAGIIALFISIKNSPNKQKSMNYYEENDYE